MEGFREKSENPFQHFCKVWWEGRQINKLVHEENRFNKTRFIFLFFENELEIQNSYEIPMMMPLTK